MERLCEVSTSSASLRTCSSSLIKSVSEPPRAVAVEKARMEVIDDDRLHN
jgi:hypothetical protein